MLLLDNPIPEAVIYEDSQVYCCLASYSLTEGHSIVVWKDSIKDLHLLNKTQYEHLMWIVDKTRNALLKTLDLEKVYLMYMDEVNQVHWHLIPRYDQKGFNVLLHNPKKIDDFSLVSKLKANWL